MCAHMRVLHKCIFALRLRLRIQQPVRRKHCCDCDLIQRWKLIETDLLYT